MIDGLDSLLGMFTEDGIPPDIEISYCGLGGFGVAEGPSGERIVSAHGHINFWDWPCALASWELSYPEFATVLVWFKRATYDPKTPIFR